MSIKEELDALMIASSRCIVKRCIVVLVTRIDIGMAIKEELDALMMAVP